MILQWHISASSLLQTTMEMERGIELWSLIILPLLRIFCNQNLIIVALIPTMTCSCALNLGMNLGVNSHSYVLWLLYSAGHSRPKLKEWWKNVANGSLSHRETSVNQIKPSFSLNDGEKEMWIRQGHTRSLFLDSHHFVSELFKRAGPA